MDTQHRAKTANQYLAQISPEQLDPDLVNKVPLEFLKSQCAVPLILEAGQLAIALADPLNIEAYDAILSVLAETPELLEALSVNGQPCARVICPAAEIERAISSCYYHDPTVEVNENTKPPAHHAGISAPSQAEDLLNIANKAPVIKLANKIIFQAVNSRASDIHIEPYENEARIRFRIDGVLHDATTLPRRQVSALVSRLKIMSNLNIAERRLPQDGQSRIKIGQNCVDIRVSVIPTSGGERVVLRLLDKASKKFGLDQIGFCPEVLHSFRELIGLSHGIILLTGPTGSGKTTTLYAAINELNCEQRNILTVEDPIEYQLPGVGQVQVKPKINLTFANCLRHILRQDPDVIMVGEIRDTETARIAIQASLTGHLVLSTLHTNDSASAVTRLIDMGIEPYLIASSVVAVMAQRLVRTICPHCKSLCDTSGKRTSQLSTSHITFDTDTPLYEGLGCKDCLQTGYLGRTGIFELLVMDDDIRELITRRQTSHGVKEAAIEKGMTTLREDGLRKALAGRTTLDEVLRVTHDALQEKTGVVERVGS